MENTNSTPERRYFFSPARHLPPTPRIFPPFLGETDVFRHRGNIWSAVPEGWKQKKKPKRHNYQTVRCEAGNRTGTTGRSTNCPPRSSPPPATFSASSCFHSLHFCASPYVHSSRSVTQWFVYFFVLFCFFNLIWVSTVFLYPFLFRDEEDEEGHWLSSSAQTCCGHPVRPFTFFSAPKDSCRPSVCDTKNTPNYHQQQEEEEEEKATGCNLGLLCTFSAYYCNISCYISTRQPRSTTENVAHPDVYSKSSNTTVYIHDLKVLWNKYQHQNILEVYSLKQKYCRINGAAGTVISLIWWLYISSLNLRLNLHNVKSSFNYLHIYLKKKKPQQRINNATMVKHSKRYLLYNISENLFNYFLPLQEGFNRQWRHDL